MKSCFFIGHREASLKIYPLLEKTIKQHIEEYGVTEFIVGNYGSFDRMAAKAVIDAKKYYPNISLLLLVPYYSVNRTMELPAGFNCSFYPPGMENVPNRFAIVRANRYMIDHVDYLIAYAWQPASNSKKLLDYARKREQKDLLNITAL